MATSVRPIWLSIHKWIGLILGFWIVFQGITGAILVYKLEIQAALNPQLYRTGMPGGQIDYDRMVEAVTSGFPDYRIAYLERDALASDESFRFVMARAGQPSSPFEDLEVFVNPQTAQIMGSRPWFTFMKAVWLLHNGLIAGPTGKLIVGILSLFLVVTLIAGVVLWWPANGKFGRALRFKLSSPGPRLLRDLHTVCGTYLFAIMLIICTTGLVIVFPAQTHAVLKVFAEIKPPSAFTADVIMPGVDRDHRVPVEPPKLNELAATVERAYPGSTVTLLIYPHNSQKGTFTFRILPAGKNPSVYTTQVYLHPREGRIIGRFDPALQPPANSFAGLWAIYIHTGHMLGMVGRVLVLISGAAFLGLFGTGIYIWLKKRPQLLAKMRSVIRSREMA